MSRDTHEDRPRSRLTALALVVVVVSTLAIASAPVAAQEDTTFIVEQGGQCIQITPLGDGTQTAEDYYNYEILNDTANYSSLGTTEIQENQVSQLFVYRGSDGLSLVFLHDAIDEPYGFAATADLSGLPSDGEWVVEDDNYTGSDDVFEYTETGAHLEWGSNGERTDGAVFSGLESPNYSTITVDIQFNEESNKYPYPEWDGAPAQNEIDRWVVRSGTGETTELDMSEPIQLSPGTCSGGVSTFTATPSGSNATVTASTETTAMPTAATTATATQTPTPTATTEPSASANESTTTGTNGMVGTTAQTGDGAGDSGAFGPGFGPGVALVALLALALVALARRGG
jgi:PGF-CTERM protein